MSLKPIFAVCSLLIALPLAACEDAGDAATLGFSDEGDLQNITVSSVPAGAACTLVRDGKMLANVAATPATVQVVETDGTIIVNCMAPGYGGSTSVPANVAGTALIGMVSNLLPNYVYPSNITVTMVPGGGAAATAALQAFGGVGAEMMEAAGQPVIVRVLANGPAQQAGLLPGDVITKVDQTPTQGVALPAVVAAVQGAPGTKVALSIIRGSARTPMAFVVTRELISSTAATEAPAMPVAGTAP